MAVDDTAVDATVGDRAIPDLAERIELGPPALDYSVPPPTGPDYAGCMGTKDLTGMPATITFGYINAMPQYVPPCVKVQIGQRVDWVATFQMMTFVDHPLTMAPTNLGKTVPTRTSMTTATATFVKPGYYGYYCTVHGSADGKGMAGLIQVVQ